MQLVLQRSTLSTKLLQAALFVISLFQTRLQGRRFGQKLLVHLPQTLLLLDGVGPTQAFSFQCLGLHVP